MKKRVLGFLLAGLAVFAMAGGAWAEAVKVLTVQDTDAVLLDAEATDNDKVVKDGQSIKVDASSATGSALSASTKNSEVTPFLAPNVVIKLVGSSTKLTIEDNTTKVWSAGDKQDNTTLTEVTSTSTPSLEAVAAGQYYLDVTAGNKHGYVKITVEDGVVAADSVITLKNGTTKEELTTLTKTTAGGTTITLDPATINAVENIAEGADWSTDGTPYDGTALPTAAAGVVNADAPVKIALSAEGTLSFGSLKVFEVAQENNAGNYKATEVTSTDAATKFVAGKKFYVQVAGKDTTNSKKLYVLVELVEAGDEGGDETTGADISFDVAVSFDVTGGTSVTVKSSDITSSDKYAADLKVSKTASVTVPSSATKIGFSVKSADLLGVYTGTSTTAITDFSVPTADTTYRVAVSFDATKVAVVEVKVTAASGTDDSTTVEEKLNSIAPKVTVKAITEAIRRAFASFFSGTIYDLYSSSTVATSADQKVISDEVVGDLASNQTAIVLPRVTITTAGVYAFTMDLSSYKGRTLTLNVVDLSTYVPTVTSYNLDLAANVSALSDAKFLDKNGNTLTTSSDYSEVNAAATFSAGSYVPYVVATSSSSDTTTTSPKSGNSGCDMGLTGGLAVLLAALLPLRGKRG